MSHRHRLLWNGILGAAHMTEDPYRHLHAEDYADDFSTGRVGWRDMVFMGGRRTVSLDGDWRFVLDLFDEGLRQKWYLDSPGDPGEWSVPRDYDAGDWQTAPVPSCWNVLKPEWTYFEGSAWYTRFFASPPLVSDERLFLRIGAANYEARVFLNGRFAGAHRGGSTPFFVELGPHLRAGENRLQIQVENRRRPDRVPMHHTDWFNYGGIYREIELVTVPEVFIRDFRVALVPNSGCSRIIAEVELSRPDEGEARLTVPALGIDVPVPVSHGHGRLEIEARPDLWSPQRPQLYDLILTCGSDTVTDKVGFREIRVEGREIFLNGDPLWLRGICCHEDDVTLGKCTDEADICRRLAHAKELGANCIRLAHYPHHEMVARLADEEGMMLFEEIPVYWAIDFENPDTFADAENQLRELMRRDANRASVIFWGVGNENADTDARFAFMRGLAATARAADPTRLVTAACLINRERFRIEDRLADALDVIGLNEYFGWYEPDFADLARLLENSDPDRPVMVTECGAEAVTGRMGAPGELFSEAHQAHVLETQFKTVRDAPYMRGFFPWLLYDFRTERRQTAFQRGYNLKGLIDRDKTRKKAAFDAVRRLYEKLAGASRPG